MDAIIPRLKVPPTVAAGVAFVVKSIISHPMETGRRKRADGEILPRRIINRVVARFDGQDVAWTEWETGIAANPYWEFQMMVPHSGRLELSWYDDNGAIYTASAAVMVS
jgi:sulfur-oxidizing protein SoxZ